MKAKVSCTSIDCPERIGDACEFDLDGTRENLVRDVCKVHPLPKGLVSRRVKRLLAAELRQQHLQMEAMEAIDLLTKNPWQAWNSSKQSLESRIKDLVGDD